MPESPIDPDHELMGSRVGLDTVSGLNERDPTPAIIANCGGVLAGTLVTDPWGS
jgi:hypothetical protein